MNSRRHLLFGILCLVAVLPVRLTSQPRTMIIEELPLGTEYAWQNPRFSPTGKSIFFTRTNFHGIWQFSLESKTVRQVTSDPHSGFGYSVSHDGKTIAYRSTTILPSHRRQQEIVVADIERDSKHVVDSGEDLSTPSFANEKLMYSKSGVRQELDSQTPGEDIQILGIENTKIVLLRGAQRILWDPFGNGSYIWPSLSPDKKHIAAYEIDRGTFVADLDGNIMAQLGRRDAPSWTYDGRWIAYMNEQDDGHQILASDILLISPDGKEIHPLTETADAIELNPACSPTEKKIVFNTLDGKIFVLTYAD